MTTDTGCPNCGATGPSCHPACKLAPWNAPLVERVRHPHNARSRVPWKTRNTLTLVSSRPTAREA